MERREIFRTHYNNNGDYDGFVFGNGIQTTNKDVELITQLSEAFYNSMDILLEKHVALSLGNVLIKGRINPYIDRRKETFCFYEPSEQQPTAQTTDKKLSARSMAQATLKAWLPLCAFNPSNKKPLEVSIEHVNSMLEDRKIKIVPEVIAMHLYEAIADTNGEGTEANIRGVIDFIKRELITPKS